MIVKVADRISSIQEYYFSRKLKEIAQMKASGRTILNLGIGSPDLPPSNEVIHSLQISSRESGNHAYQSYSGIPELREAFANWYQKYFSVTLNPNGEILPLIGSKEGIMHITMTFLQPGDEVLIPNPGYPAYRATASLAGATARTYDLSIENNWLPDLDQLAAQDLSKVKIMWINYPHMPTGAQASKSFFQQLIHFAKANEILICNDNPYSFILNNKPLSLLSIDGAKEVALELNSLSKSHNMAGWRIGMLAGSEIYLKEIMKFKSNMDSGMFRPLQLAAVQALSNPDSWYTNLNEIYRKRQQKVFQLLDLLGGKYDSNQTGMFVWAHVPNQYQDGYELSDIILDKTGVFITPGGIFGNAGDHYIRISLCNNISVFDQAINLVQSFLRKEQNNVKHIQE